MNDPIPLYLISGFLGSGKTTLLQNIINHSDGQQIGVIVNEFGDIGVDGAVLRCESDVRVVELNRGSIFCACLKDRFVGTLKVFATLPIDLLIIENSGMADPSSMNTLLKNLSPYLERPYDYQGSICLVDSTNFMELVDILVPTQNQILASGLVLVNKTDLAERDGIAEIHQKITELNPQARIYDTTFAQVPSALLAGQLINHGYEAESSNTVQTRPTTFVLDATDRVDGAALERFCEKLQPYVWRAKGFVPGGDAWWRVNITTSQIIIEQSELPEKWRKAQGKLVVICKEQDESVKELIYQYWQETAE